MLRWCGRGARGRISAAVHGCRQAKKVRKAKRRRRDEEEGGGGDDVPVEEAEVGAAATAGHDDGRCVVRGGHGLVRRPDAPCAGRQSG